MTGGGAEVAREENGASLVGEERGAGVFQGRGGGDELLEEEKRNFCCTQPTKLLLFCSLVLKYQKINFCSSILAVEN